MSGFSNYIVYADESGSPTLERPDPNYPLFVLAFLIVQKDHYRNVVVPQIQKLKFDFFGHDQIILHERDIRRQSGAFAKFQVSSNNRFRFLNRINELVTEATFDLVIAVIDKPKLTSRYKNPWSPYDIALTFCMERTRKLLLEYEQHHRNVHVVFEARGATEDHALELQFYRIESGDYPLAKNDQTSDTVFWSSLFADKRSNSAGLQLADLVARPAGLRMLKPDQQNRAFDCFKNKLFQGEIKCFP